MAGPSLFANLARAAKVIALLLFFLPWVAVSCSPDAMQRVQSAAQEAAPEAARPSLNATAPSITIATASGLQLALGQISMVNPMGDMPSSGGPENKGAERAPSVSPEIGVIAGAALLLLGLIASFLLKGGAGGIAAAGASLLALAGFCYSVFISYPPAVIAAFAAGQQGNNATAEQVAQILSVKPQTGFYFVLIALVLAIAFNLLSTKKAAPAVVAAPVPAPPPTEPPAAV